MSSSDPVRPALSVPSTLRWAGYVTAVQGAVGLIVAVVLVVREAAGHHEAAISGYGTAVWFTVIGGGVCAGGIALTRGRRWGRAVSLMAQILLLPVAYTLITGSGQAVFGVPVGVVALGVLVLLFAPASLTWLNADDLPPDA
ncbi:hypothetical protein [Gordonia neofelifaecis]|uniref:Integral membrane protein n=1 Tax=Gordonia neofelifaecis NRRL B-59395 TaxID=644548 RepID=F1YJJ8_9ACTN|nr:hypothetical protein [Gordonia neofelifaecis]EGD55231.1 hypothetical protein SCNU_10174 [Gordonia neofelifaecis NRRL B-59395]